MVSAVAGRAVSAGRVSPGCFEGPGISAAVGSPPRPPATSPRTKRLERVRKIMLLSELMLPIVQRCPLVVTDLGGAFSSCCTLWIPFPAPETQLIPESDLNSSLQQLKCFFTHLKNYFSPRCSGGHPRFFPILGLNFGSSASPRSLSAPKVTRSRRGHSTIETEEDSGARLKDRGCLDPLLAPCLRIWNCAAF